MGAKIAPPRGMRDVLPAEAALRESVLSVIKQTYVAHGFCQIETPHVENIDRLKSSQAGENEKLIFEILRRGLKQDELATTKDLTDLGLRYDLTLPLARFYASNFANLPSIFSAFQIGHVFRAERPQKGRFRSFLQCDIDVIGEASILAEVRVISAVYEALKNLGLSQKAKVLINDRKLLLKSLEGILPAHMTGLALIELDKIDKIGTEKVATNLSEICSVDVKTSQTIIEAIQSIKPDESIIKICQALKDLSSDICVEFTPNLVRGMGYYTGSIFEIVHEDFGGSIAGGGRYDGVIGRFLNTDIPSCGMSIGFERIIGILSEKANGNNNVSYIQANSSQQSIAVLYTANDNIVEVIECVKNLKGYAIVLPKKIKQSFFDHLKQHGFTKVYKVEQQKLIDL